MKMSDVFRYLLLGTLVLYLLLSLLLFLLRYSFNYYVQYAYLVILTILLSGMILVKALEKMEWGKSIEEERRVEGNLRRMTRRIHLAHSGFPFTQNLLRRRLQKIFEEEGISVEDPEIKTFLETPIEEKRLLRGDEAYMKKFSAVLTLLEASV